MYDKELTVEVLEQIQFFGRSGAYEVLKGKIYLEVDPGSH